MNRGRRQIVATIVLAALGTRVAIAQQKPARVVVLSRSPVPEVSEFRERMRELGWVEGKTWVLEERYATTSAPLQVLAVEVAGTRPDVIFAAHTEAALAAKVATSTIPIVFSAADPVAIGLVESLARPGGNATGMWSDADESGGKRFEILRDAFPGARQFAFLHSGSGFSGVDALRKTADLLKLELVSIPVDGATAIGPAVEEAARRGAEGMLLGGSPLFRSQAATIAILAARHRIPVIYQYLAVVEAGGLMSYGPDPRKMARRLATFVDRLLKGARPADIPVERWDRFELVINLRTASALGFTIPPSLVALADRVIE